MGPVIKGSTGRKHRDHVFGGDVPSRQRDVATTGSGCDGVAHGNGSGTTNCNVHACGTSTILHEYRSGREGIKELGRKIEGILIVQAWSLVTPILFVKGIERKHIVLTFIK